MAGVTPQGFVTRPLADVREQIDDEIRTSLGDSVRLDGRSVLGQLAGAAAILASDIWIALGELPGGLDPDTAVGAQLDQITALSGVSPRESAAPSTGTVTITGTVATVVPAGARVRSSDTGVVVETLTDATIPASGSVDVSVQSVETGPLEAAAATLTEIITPYPGWSSVTNAAPLTPGRNIETDLELRIRRAASLQSTGAGTDGGIRAALLALNEVEQVVVRSNRTTATLVDGTPRAAVRVVVYPDPSSAAVEETIARAYFPQLPAGVQAYGTQAVATVTDAQGIDQVIRWDYADEVTIHAIIAVTVTSGSGLAAGDVQAAVVAYVNALRVGDDVRILQIQRAIQDVSEDVLAINTLLIGVSSPPAGTGDITIDLDQIARTSAATIAVTVTT